MRVVAEGVEERNQIDFLRAIHCDMAQGYYFARPMPEESFRKLVS
ncbi:MAG: EAL domain-containing protein [Clostridium sp.]